MQTDLCYFNSEAKPTFIDLFAGCGGLSLGLMNAGWRGLFAVEKNADAFHTLKHNLIENKKPGFFWPEWLPKAELSLEELTEKYISELKSLSGHVHLLAGGPPCQGFSTFGRRSPNDPRNQVFRQYLKVVELIRPQIVLIENVKGIMCQFKGVKSLKKNDGKPLIYAEIIQNALSDEYEIATAIVKAKDFGVPQTRPRFILIGLRKSNILKGAPSILDFFYRLEEFRVKFLKIKGLQENYTTVHNAISDLCQSSGMLYECIDNPRFKQGSYGNQTSKYQQLMHGNMNGAIADSHRFAKHRPTTVEKFEWFQKWCISGRKLDQDERGEYANKKHTVYILNANLPAPTVTTLPDDMIHYAEPRILTVREMARLQSFPDWFQFKGKYTTGGDRRTKECPRYTQVGNAVPPLLAEAIGRTLLNFGAKVTRAHK